MRLDTFTFMVHKLKKESDVVRIHFCNMIHGLVTTSNRLIILSIIILLNIFYPHLIAVLFSVSETRQQMTLPDLDIVSASC